MAIPWLESFVAASHTALQALPPAHPARAYLASRGVSEALLTAYRVGWVPSPQVAECSPKFWDWIRKYGWDRMLFPLTDPFGAVIGLQLRSLKDKSYEDFLAQPTELCPGTFGLHTALPVAFETGKLVLVEGVFDYFAVRQVTPGVLGLLTSNASLSVKRMLSRYLQRCVCLFDMDAAGRRGACRLAGLPVPEQYQKPTDKTARQTPVPPYQVVIPAYTEHDPADLLKAGKRDELQRLVNLG